MSPDPRARTAVRLRAASPPRPAPKLDPDQRAVVAAGMHESALVVYGAPGSGRTTTLLALAEEYARGQSASADGLLILAPTRVSAGQLAAELSLRIGNTSSAPMVRTASSLAFSILRAEAVRLGEPAPVLISGAEQDAILAELLAGHRDDPSALGWPTKIPVEALALRGFRGELRDLLMRAAERGISPDELARLGKAWNRPEWESAAIIYAEYQQTNALRRTAFDAPVRYDPAAIVFEATAALRAWDTLVLPEGEMAPEIPRPHWPLVLVDDYHEATAATAALLRGLHDFGSRVVFFTDPDSSVQGFRGAVPGLGAQSEHPKAIGQDASAQDHGFDAKALILPTVWRHGPAIRAAVRAVTDRIRSAGAVTHRRGSAAPGPMGDVEIGVFTSASAEVGAIARRLREAHLTQAMPWNEMALIVRSGSEVSRLRQGLAISGVPVVAASPEVSVRDEPAVRPFLIALQCIVDPSALDADASVGLLTSPIGGADAVALRRLRRALRVEEVAHDGTRTSDDLLVEALADPRNTLMLENEVRRPALRVAEVLAAGRQANDLLGASATDALWAVWQASGLAEPWRRTALGAGPGAARADLDLDAMVALFAAAERFGERMPHAGTALFLAEILAQDLPEDTLAPRAPSDERVQVLTSATAAGQQWGLVVVAGVQDGSWPDLRVRDSALGALSLVDVLAGRATDGVSSGAEARRAVLDDELRTFAVALSRARTTLFVTAVANAEEQPSVFLDLLDWNVDGAGATASDEPREAADAPRPFDLRGLVADLRANLMAAGAQHGIASAGPKDAIARLSDDSAESADAKTQEIAEVLAWLADEQVPGAAPQTWMGLLTESTDEPLWQSTQMVPVSPSKVEAFDRCGLRWMLESAGGTDADSTSQAVGTLVHEIAAKFPDADLATLEGELDRRWPSLGLGTAWPGMQQRQAAERIVTRLAGYFAKAEVPIHVEESFTAEFGRARLRGQIDRVEPVTQPGIGHGASDAAPDDSARRPVRIVDLKTGKAAIANSEAERNPQLGAYQAAIDAGALGDDLVAAGAALVFVGTDARAATIREQPALSEAADPAWAASLVATVAEGMSASGFAAKANSLCPMCRVRTSCPLQAEGRQVNS